MLAVLVNGCICSPGTDEPTTCHRQNLRQPQTRACGAGGCMEEANGDKVTSCTETMGRGDAGLLIQCVYEYPCHRDAGR
jgi:hypothetical protein